MNEELITKEIENNKEEYIEFLRELIKTESYNPPGNEKNVALKIEEYLTQVGIKCEIFSFSDNRANLFAYLNDNFNGKNLLFNGHMDVVPPGLENEWKNPPLSAFVKRKKYIYGRGAADMKGGLAAMVIALRILKKLGLGGSGNLILNAVADEELGGKFGTIWSLENKLKSIKCNFTIIGEPTVFSPLPTSIIIGEKGHLRIKLITHGISCHSSTPFMGKNAIYMMSEIIQNLDKLEKYLPIKEPPISFNKIKKLIASVFPNKELFEQLYNIHPKLQNFIKILTTSTKSVNMINGGIKENVIPDKCEAIIDFRTLPGQTTENIVNALKKFITELGYLVKDIPNEKSKEIYVHLEVYYQSEASFWYEWEKSTVLKDFYHIIKNIYKRTPFYSLSPAGSDAKYFRNSNYCPQTILFGPGEAATSHAIDEYIEIQDFINAIKVYTIFAHNFLK